MMEASTSTGKASPPPMISPRTAGAAAAPPSANANAAPTGAKPAPVAPPGIVGTSFKVPAMPKVITDKTDDITNRIVATDIARINGYMRFANLGAAILLFVTCFIRMFMVPSYSDFLVVFYIMFMASALVFIENHNQFPSIAEKVKNNFGFMFNAKGKAGFILCISFLAFSQGWIGTLLGIFLMIIALFNFFLIHRHPAYQAHMTTTQSQQQADLEAMPELRYNQSQQPTAQTAHVVV